MFDKKTDDIKKALRFFSIWQEFCRSIRVHLRLALPEGLPLLKRIRYPI